MRVPSSPHSNYEWRAGAYQALPLSFGVAAYGWVWGALAVQAGLAPFEAALMSATVFAGTAQFVTLAIWQEPASGWSLMTLMTATLAVNLRFALMSASLQPLFEREGVHRRYFKAFFVSDENWALTSYEMTQGRGSVGFLLGAGGAIYLTWVVGTILGGLMGAGIPEPRRLGLDFAFVASLLALLLSMWRGWARVLPWASAAAGATLGYEVLPGKWYIVLGGVCGSAVAAWSSNAGRVDNEKS